MLPLMISDMGTLELARKTNRFIPTGGVIMAICEPSTQTTPTQFGSKPRSISVLYKNGMVSSTMLVGSIRQPSTNHSMYIKISIT